MSFAANEGKGSQWRVHGMRFACKVHPVYCYRRMDYMMTLKHSCRPRVGLQEAHNLSDIQRFFIVMAPTSRKAPMRLAAVGKKQLPNTGGRFWACIQGLSDKVTRVPKLACLYGVQPPTLHPRPFTLLWGRPAWRLRARNQVPDTKGLQGHSIGLSR